MTGINGELPRLLVCGSREWSDEEVITRVLLERGPAVVMHGGARGADRIADRVARRLGWPVEAFPADWARYGKAAGPRRNAVMLDTKPDLVIAFSVIPDGTSGTRNTIDGALRRGLRTLVVTPDGTELQPTVPWPRDTGPAAGGGSVSVTGEL